MNDKFQQRLGAANARAKAAHEQAAAEKANAAAEWGQRIKSVQQSLTEWNGRIAPAIMAAVTEANQLIGDTGITLTATPNVAHVRFLSGGNTPPMPPLPLIVVAAGKKAMPPPVRRPARTAAVQRAAIPPSVQIGINHEGQITVRFTNTENITAHPPASAAQFTEDDLKSIIADFVDALTPTMGEERR